MKVKLNNHIKRTSLSGFTLIEMIGVLAVIAILAAVLIPKVFEAIQNSRISNAAMTIQTVKTALADHYAKFGGLAVDGSVTPPAAIATLPDTDFDKILLKEGFMDKPFAVKIGDGDDTKNNIIIGNVATGVTAAELANMAYNLQGGGSALDTIVGTTVVEAHISGVSLEDAAALDRVIDGPATTMSSPASKGKDLQGRVKWDKVGSTYDIYVYLTHR